VSLWYAVFAGVGAFGAIRFTHELGQSDQQFGVLTSAGAILTLFLTIGAGFFLDRVSLRRLHITICCIASGFAMLMGITDSLLLSGIGYILSTSIFTTVVGPSSMWVSRSAGPELQGAGFTAFKVMNAFYVAIVMALLGFLEHWTSLRAIFFGIGLCGFIMSFAFTVLQEPTAAGAMQLEPEATAPEEIPVAA
jgi:sugar phosphate permease